MQASRHLSLSLLFMTICRGGADVSNRNSNSIMHKSSRSYIPLKPGYVDSYCREGEVAIVTPHITKMLSL